ncbi:MAG: Glycosyl transferase group 1 [Candidatus Moranbacteria bacterium GW2011_GWE2_35_2-]|nr:MAG: Glycosyl transferase group 1 [Candidatus Moranbacteria bacterium GW2011_GWE2_35_2-]KKQ06249.1 MAG: Glycosyl transferase group 1 [Candidatus Moranbacteria bacterium GW2011_GWF1_36_4]KKQ22835.1 MAG: Glycosyl transferase group 1 [Candidatus Moranbacteria bacterium GW2011_GWF2_37_11]KKQ28653.1 MAG: Glycosyl transferase group 1 [Candidatus Moranbacteria bacterium GW2011_GWD1_37_17]KKQ30934.1 MAG: Glycosyl transferase group 1 [Candidatus Moranbacteria bacterium GW2011_GWE1_37_24]KKQ47203.1 M
MTKKILLITRPIAPPWDEASKNFAFTLAKDLSDNKNLELHLMTNGQVDELPSSVIQEKIYTHSQNDFGFFQKLRLFWFLILNAYKFDILHLLFTPTKFNTGMMRVVLNISGSRIFFGKNSGMTDIQSIQTVATLRQDLFSDEELKNLMFGDLIITYSDFAKEKLLSLGIKNVERIYPGIDLENYSPKETRVKNENYALNDFVINFAGEYTRLGAMDDVVEAFIKVSGKIPTAKLSMAVRVKNKKDADNKNKVVEKLMKNNLLEKVVFHDDGKFNMADIYNMADISIFPVQNMRGKFDVPLVVVEAMACAKPVIISNIPILEEFSNKENSVRIEAGNVEQLTAAILDLHDNPEKRKKLGISARKYVEQNFDIKNVSKQYAEIYEKI